MTRTITRKNFLKVAGAGLAGATLLGPMGCRLEETQTGGASTLIVSQLVDASTLDPQMQGTMTDMSILINIFDTLTTRDKNEELAPSLATDWQALDDTTWQFKLREGVKFHNGEPFNAEAVKYSIERVLDPATKSPIVELSLVEFVKKVDDYTVDFIMSDPDPILPEKVSLFGGAMVPPKYIQEQGDDVFASKPVGTGPFKFVEWRRGDRVEVEAYPDYWGGAPEVKRVVFRKIPSEADALAAARTGEVDIVSDISADAAAQLEGSEDAEVVSVSGIRTFAVSLNAEDGGPLAKKEVRQALNYAVDVDALVKTVLGGYASQLATLVPEQSWGYAESVTPYNHDPSKARELLTQAGYGQGFTTQLSALSEDESIVQAIAGQLQKVGVNVRINLLDPGTFEQNLLTQDAGNLGPLFFFGNTPWTLDAFSSFQSFIRSSDTQSRFNNERANELVTTVETTLEQNNRLGASVELQELLKEEAPFIYLYQIDNIYAMNPRVEWEPNATGLLQMHDASLREAQ
jgi:peptide/nickel transport system substrate-binding protein